ncbi:ABC transporter permease [Candidatus Planktophila versatilis]|nr:ABC transporter permease [Candidatus Planktophila versatilis]
MSEKTDSKVKNNAARPPSFWRRFGMQFGIWGVGIAMWLVFVVTASEAFTSKDIYLAFASSTPLFALMAIPLTLIVITGEIDLSFPAVMALSTATFAKIYSGTGNIWLGFAGALIAGTLSGYFNGWLVTYFAIPSLVITIGTGFLFRGIELAWMNGSGVGLTDKELAGVSNLLVGRSFFGIANQFWWAVLATIILWFVLNRTQFGAHVFLTGDNKTSAQLMGVNVNQVKRRTFAIMGFFAAFAGLVASFEVSYFWPTLGEGLLMNSIASVFLGGTSVFGGIGTVTGTFVGSFIIGAINAGIVASGINAFYTQVFFGLVIILSVIMQAVISKKIKR